jgi:hypothetical protein
VAGGEGISVDLSGQSPATGDEERVRVVTRELPDGHVLYVLAVVPGQAAPALMPTLSRMISTLRLERGGSHR